MKISVSKCLLLLSIFTFCLHKYVICMIKKDIKKYRDQVKSMFYHAYNGYMANAYPYDELRPLTCDGHDTWGSYSLTLIDALDTLAALGNKTEFQRVQNLIIQKSNFDVDINVSVFETNIRIVGGLLSAHLMAKRMGVQTEGWPCDGPLLKLAEDVANRLLPAFDTPTGMPYGTVNLKNGVPPGETSITCTAGVGTYVVEFGTLSRLTNNPVYEDAAVRAMHAVWHYRSSINLLGNHVDVLTGRWTAQDSGIGAGVDSFFEYLVKGSLLLRRPELMAIFKESRKAIEKYLKHDDWYLWGTMNKGHITMAVFQNLEAFWPGVLTLVGDLDSAQKTIFNYHNVWKQFGFTPEFYNIPQNEAPANREGYPLRPELAESLVYLYQATKDHTFLEMGADIVTSILHSAKTPCGFATVKNVNDHSLDNRMESFFLAETTKYLYLLFDHDNWLHNNGGHGKYHQVGNRECVIEAGGYIYNSEAHPVDPGALNCCSGPEKEDLFFNSEDLISMLIDPSKPVNTNRGELASSYLKKKEMESLNAEKDLLCDDVDDIDTYNDAQLDSDNIGSIKEILNKAIIKLKANADKVPKISLNENIFNTGVTSSASAEKLNEDQLTPEYEITENIVNSETEKELEESVISKNVEQKIVDRIDLEPQSIDTNNTKFETSAISSSVSSSKYNLNMPQSSSKILTPVENKISLPKPKRNKIFSLDSLKERLRDDLNSYSNITKSVSHAILSCNHPPFLNMLNFKGQMFYP